MAQRGAIAGGAFLLFLIASAPEGVAQGVPANPDPSALPLNARMNFKIEPGSVSDAINQFARRADLQVVYDARLAQGQRSGGVNGVFTAREALAQVLQGTDLGYSINIDSSVNIYHLNGDDRFTLDTIVVDAHKGGPEDVQTLPDSVFVFNSDDLQDTRTRAVSGVLRQTPNTSFEQRSNGDVIVNLRGNSNRNNNTDTGVGIYVDGAYTHIQGNSSFLPLFDVEQVNVLLGPQGTLYGRNAVGGALNIETADPTDVYGFGLTGETGNYNANWLDGFVNMPTFDGQLNFRLAGFVETRDGYFFNPVNGLDEEGVNRHGIRFKTQFIPSDDLEVVLGIERIEQDLPGNNLIDVAQLNNLNTFTDIIGSTERNWTRFTSEVRWSVTDWMDFRSITGYSTPDGVTVLDGTPSTVLDQVIRNEFDAKQLSQEFLLTSPPDAFESIKWLFGVNIFSDRIDTVQDTSLINLPGAGAFFNGTTVNTDIDGKIDQVAVFGELTYSMFDDRLHATGSLRYSREKKSVEVNNALLNATAAQAALAGLILDPNVDASDTYDRLNPGASLAFDVTPDLLTYFKFATAYKSGGVNFRSAPTAAQVLFDPEDVQSYELGFKSSWFDDRLIINAVGFFQQQQDVQLRTRDIAAAQNFFTNVGDATTWGAELYVSAKPLENLTLTASYGYLYPTFDSGTVIQASTLSGVPGPFGGQLPLAGLQNVSGNVIPFSPEHTFNASAEFVFDGPFESVGRLYAEYYLTQGGYADAVNIFELDTKSVVNISGWLEKGAVSFGFFVDNVFDEAHWEVDPTFATFTAPPLGQRNAPRTYGVRLRLLFGG